MREIDNKINSVNFKGIQKPAQVENPQESNVANPVDVKEINDLVNVPEATLGKSQISSDSIENDMKFLDKNPKLAKALNDAIEQYSKTHSEEETIKFLDKVHQEFVAKK